MFPSPSRSASLINSYRKTQNASPCHFCAKPTPSQSQSQQQQSPPSPKSQLRTLAKALLVHLSFLSWHFIPKSCENSCQILKRHHSEFIYNWITLKMWIDEELIWDFSHMSPRYIHGLICHQTISIALTEFKIYPWPYMTPTNKWNI